MLTLFEKNKGLIGAFFFIALLTSKGVYGCPILEVTLVSPHQQGRIIPKVHGQPPGGFWVDFNLKNIGKKDISVYGEMRDTETRAIRYTFWQDPEDFFSKVHYANAEPNIKSYPIFPNQSITFGFHFNYTGLPKPHVVDGVLTDPFRFSFFGDFFADGKSYVSDSVTIELYDKSVPAAPVPEPATLALIMVGGMIVPFLKRKTNNIINKA